VPATKADNLDKKKENERKRERVSRRRVTNERKTG
jgi:hypothetical protein